MVLVMNDRSAKIIWIFWKFETFLHKLLLPDKNDITITDDDIFLFLFLKPEGYPTTIFYIFIIRIYKLIFPFNNNNNNKTVGKKTYSRFTFRSNWFNQHHSRYNIFWKHNSYLSTKRYKHNCGYCVFGIISK